MKIYLVGNPLVEQDSLPFKLIPKLRKEFPELEFVEADPNENFIPEENSVIIDTVAGIDDVRWFDAPDEFVSGKSVSPHDYDLGLHLQLMKKLGKLGQVKILGVPQTAGLQPVFEKIRLLLENL